VSEEGKDVKKKEEARKRWEARKVEEIVTQSQSDST
jgi:hypothetical protein